MMIPAMTRLVRTETRTGQQVVRISLPRVDMLLAEQPERYSVPAEETPPPPVAQKPGPAKGRRWR